MLSKDSYNMLKWISKHDKWMSAAEIRREYKAFEDNAFKVIVEAAYLDKRFNCDGNQWVQYRISETGKAYIEERSQRWLPEFREWINTAIPIITFLAGLSLSDPLKAFFQWLWELLS